MYIGIDVLGIYVFTCVEYVCIRTYIQGDEGHSMFIVVEGQLSVVVTFGSGPTAQKKEVVHLGMCVCSDVCEEGGRASRNVCV